MEILPARPRREFVILAAMSLKEALRPDRPGPVPAASWRLFPRTGPERTAESDFLNNVPSFVKVKNRSFFSQVSKTSEGGNAAV